MMPLLFSHQGFHTTPTTRFALRAVRGSRKHSCTLHLYPILPTQLFTDPYGLAHHHASYTFKLLGGGDLKALMFAPAASRPSGLLLDVNIPKGVYIMDQDQGEGENKEFSIELPLHA